MTIKNFITCDLSLKSSGLCYFRDGELFDFEVIDSLEPAEPELVLIANSTRIVEFVKKYAEDLDLIALERFAFMAKSGDKDRLWANCWMARCGIRSKGITSPFREISVSTWRGPLFDKFEKDGVKLAAQQLKTCKLKGLKGEARKEMLAKREKLERLADIKWATVKKLPGEVRCRFETYLEKRELPEECIFDITDAYFIGQYVLSGKEPVKKPRKPRKAKKGSQED